MTPHYCMWRPGAPGRSHTSFEPCVRGRYYGPSSRHDLPRCDGRHIRSTAAAGTGQQEATCHMLSPPLHPPDGHHRAFHPPLRFLTQHHPRTQPFPYKSPMLCQSHRTQDSPSSATHHGSRSTPVVSCGLCTPSTCTFRKSRWIAFHALNDSYHECRSARLALGHPLPARSQRDPRSGVEAHWCTHTGAVVLRPLHTTGSINGEVTQPPLRR